MILTDRYFYIIEKDGDGNNILRIMANVYFNDTGYMISEWTFLYIDICLLKSLLISGMFYDYIYERIDYIDDITYDSAIYICNNYFIGSVCNELSIYDVNENTKCGCYWFERRNAR